MSNLAKIFVALVVFTNSFFVKAQEPAIIPYPVDIKINTGYFHLSSQTQLVLNDKGNFTNEVFTFQSMIEPALGQYLSTSQGVNKIIFNYSDAISSVEEYKLEISPETISITAGSPSGAFYAIQTIRQLLPVEIESGQKIDKQILLPTLSINDKPAFEWRGSHIDVSRHFFSIEYLKKHIDRLALYKMNKLHIHLTDDQGWRIEIKKYPELTEKSAWRNYNDQDSACIKKSVENPDFTIDNRYIIKKENEDIYGGYFTQDQIKELVRYAQSKHVELIPEIDMPGHMMAAIQVYPHLTDSKHIGWGELFSVPLCPCKEEVYTFVEDVLTEIIDLFPSNYIHIGADEVEKTTWKESELCKQLMLKEGIENVNELQSYFVRRVQKFVESKGKQIIGWDEVLEGGVNSNVNIMFWRGWVPNAPAKAANNGNYVIMTPTNPLYFNADQNKSSLYNTYNMQIIYDDIPKDKHHLIKGAQANLWAEQISSENRSEFLLFPRITALAERTWTNKNLFENYSQRLLKHYPRFDVLGINFRLPDVEEFTQESVFINETNFFLISPLHNMQIRYTTDSSLPDINSQILDKPYLINKPQQIKFALFSEGGVRGEIHTINYRKSDLNKSINVKANKKGLKCDFYDQRIDKTTKIDGKPNKQYIMPNIDVPKDIKAPSFGLVFNGYVNVPETGIYSFFFTIDDSAKLFIDDEEIIDNEGPHSPVEKSGQAALEKGLHPIKILFVEGGGGFTLRMEYSFNGSKAKPIPDSWFVH